MNKKGLSLIVLIITIVLIIILLGITTATAGNAIQNARMTSFGNDLKTIEDAIDVYYIQNGEFPILAENDKFIEYEYNDSVLQAVQGSNTIELNQGYLSDFKEELTKNLDLTDGENVVSDTVFYKIDLNKIDVKKTSRGTGKDGENDIYVMAYPSQNVYYIKGVIADKKIYFSLANISTVQKVQNENNYITVLSESGITVTREKKAWTNTLGITIKANLNSSDKLYVKLPVRAEEITLVTTEGENNISINSLNVSLGLSEEEITQFNSLELSEKYMNIIKKTNGVEVSNIRVSLANYETEVPSFPLKQDDQTFDFNIESFEGYNKVSYKGIDNISGIKEVRYVYLTELKDNANIETLISDTSTLTSNYMIQNGKKAYVSNDGNVEIKLPKDIEAIYITMFDKAGNSISMQKNVQTDIYIGINPVMISNTLKFNIVIKSATEILSSSASISFDENNFIDKKDLTLTNVSNYIYKSTVEFDNTKEKDLYIKVTCTDKSTPSKTETRIKKIDLEKIANELISSAIPGNIYEENRYYKDVNGDSAIVPAGFMVSTKSDEQIIDNGLVIIDKLDNEFVWVPVDGTDITYTKYFSYYTNPDDSDVIPVDDQKEQITKYGGFYIGRYEAGVPANQTTIDGTSADTSNTTGTPVVQKGATVWTYISYTNANTSSLVFCDTNYVKSGLVTGTQIDVVMKWIEKSGISIINPITWGNYSNSESPANVTGYGSKQVAGYSEYWKAKNIYDLAGNISEWVGEYSENGVNLKHHLGGSYSDASTSLLNSGYSNISFSYVDPYGFRIVLYVM